MALRFGEPGASFAAHRAAASCDEVVDRTDLRPGGEDRLVEGGPGALLALLRVAHFRKRGVQRAVRLVDAAKRSDRVAQAVRGVHSGTVDRLLGEGHLVGELGCCRRAGGDQCPCLGEVLGGLGEGGFDLCCGLPKVHVRPVDCVEQCCRLADRLLGSLRGDRRCAALAGGKSCPTPAHSLLGSGQAVLGLGHVVRDCAERLGGVALGQRCESLDGRREPRA